MFTRLFIKSVVLLLMLSSGSMGVVRGDSYTVNLVDSLADTKSQLLAGQTADIMVIGDSHSFKPESSYLPFLTELLQNHYGNAGAGYQGFSRWTGAQMNYGWFAGGSNEDLPPHRSLDGLWNESSLGPFAETGLHNTATFIALSSNVELHYLSRPGGGIFDIFTDEDRTTPLATIDTRSTTQQVSTWRYWYHDQTSERQLIFQPRGDGPVTILGQVNSNTEPGVRIHRAANGGWGVDNFLQRDETFDQQVQLINPDLMMVMLGTNDAAYEQEPYRQKLHELVDRLEVDAPEAEIILISSFNVGPSSLERRSDAMRQVAEERSIGYIDLYHGAGNCTYMNMNEYVSTDRIHLTEAGGQYISQVLYDAWITDGQSLAQPACIEGDVDCDGRVGLMDIDLLGKYFADRAIYECLEGDADCNGEVGLTDLDIIGRNYGTQQDLLEGGDLNGDHFVDLIDLDILGRNYGNALVGCGSNDIWLYGDLNCDGIVDLLDLDILGTHYGDTKVVPEPDVLAMGFILAAMAGGRSRQQ